MKATYIKTQLTNLVNITQIVTIHYYEFDKNFSYGGESHDFWEMVYVDKGKVLVSNEKDEIVLSQGDIVFHKPNEFHAIRAYESAPNFFVITFVCKSPSMKFLEEYHTKLDENLRPFISSIIKESDLTFIIPKNDPTLTRLVKKDDAIIGGEQLIKTYLEQLLISLIRNVQRVNDVNIFTSKQGMENHLIESIKSYLDKNVESKVKISDICAKLGYSKSYLCKIFSDQTGQSISNYGTHAKIKRAKQLIRENKYNFSQISDILNFDNSQYFSRVFKRITGMTPTEFKETLDL